MKILKSTLIVSLTILVMSSGAFGVTTESGYLNSTSDSNEFSVDLKSTAIDMEFTYPNGSDFYVTVLGMYGDPLGIFRLADGEIIELSGGGKFTLKVTSESGNGAWTCSWDDNAGSGGYESGYLSDPGESTEFPLNAGSSTLVEVTFDWPNGTDFYVTVYGMSHNELGDFRLADGEVIELTGGGQFYLEVYSMHGGGYWTATW